MRRLFLDRLSEFNPQLAASPRILIVAPSKWKCAPDDLQVGWRITTGDGQPYDLMWGATKRERLDQLTSELRDKHGPVDVVELTTRDDLRDRNHYEKVAS